MDWNLGPRCLVCVHDAGNSLYTGRLLVMLRKLFNLVAALCFLILPRILPAADGKPILLVNSDHRTSISLNGDWHAVFDPYDNGYLDFRMQARPDGYFLNDKPGKSDKLVEYDFAK